MEAAPQAGILFVTLATIIIPLLFLKLLQNRRGRLRRLPPGPPPLPVVGNLMAVGQQPHRTLRRLAERYGPLMLLQLGQIPTVVVSSADVAREVLKTQDLAFCTRPPLSGLRKIFYGGLDIAFTPYNAFWRQARRICTSQLLSASRVQLLRPIREQEIDALVETIRARSPAPASPPLNLSELFVSLLNNITCREVFGKRFGGESGRCPFHDLVTEWTSLMGHFNVGEYFPSIEWINCFSELPGRFKNNFEEIDAFLDQVIDAHLAAQGESEKEEEEHEFFLSVLLQLHRDPTLEIPLTKQHIKAILMDLFIAGTDTGAIALEWGMSELMRNPRVRHKAQAEIRSAVGPMAARVEESDLPNLPYLKLVVREILRLHPPAPFLLPRQSRCDCRVDDYDIPAGTRVSINVWAIGRDPSKWDAAEEFRPERFEDSAVDFRGQHFEMLPFGAGRRGCPGVALGSVVVELALANLLYAFDWKVEEGMEEEELDMDESFGIVVRRKSPLRLIAVPLVTG